MKLTLEKVSMYVLGFILVLFGLNKGLNFITLPTPPEEAIGFLTGIGGSGYVFPTLMILEIMFGLSLLFNKYTKVTLLLLLPVLYNIFMYHLLMDVSGIIIPAVMVVTTSYLIWEKKDEYKSLLV